MLLPFASCSHALLCDHIRTIDFCLGICTRRDVMHQTWKAMCIGEMLCVGFLVCLVCDHPASGLSVPHPSWWCQPCWMGKCMFWQWGPLLLNAAEEVMGRQKALPWSYCTADCRRATYRLQGPKPASRASASACTHQRYLKYCLPLYRCCGGSKAGQTDATSCTGESSLTCPPAMSVP